MSSTNAISNAAAAAGTGGTVSDVSVVENSDISRLDNLTRAKIGAGLPIDFIPSWDKGRVEEGRVISFLDDPMPESERVKIASRVVRGPEFLVLAMCADSPSFVPG